MAMKSLDQIAAELQGYDPQALSVDAVNAFLGAMVQPVQETEMLPIMDALGRTLASDVISPVSVPPHDNSAMDGYAFSGEALLGDKQRDLTLKVVATALAGKAWTGQVGSGECVKITTGAVMPEGLDTVVPMEMTTEHDGQVTFSRSTLKPGDNRRFCGEDIMAGQAALRQGQHLNAAALGLVASLGLPQVAVYRRLRVAYFSTGNEILSLGDSPREGAVYDSNRYTVFGLLSQLGCHVIDMGVVPDDPAQLEAAFLTAASQADAIITSGGVSVGEADFTKAMMKKLGDVAFWRIAMRPGRPMAVGRIASSVLFGLPGNPVAVMVTFLAFVRPALLTMMGRGVSASLLVKARSVAELRKKPGRTEYQRGTVTRHPEGHLQVSIDGNQGSGVLSSMVNGNCLVVLHHSQGGVKPGEEVDVLMLEGLI